MNEIGLAPEVDDLSVFLLGGRVESAAGAITEAQDAERLGFSQVWLCERFEVKEAGAILGAAAAVTSRLGVVSGPTVPSARPPLVLASMGATLHSLSGGRFTMGVGRGPAASYFEGWGFSQLSYAELIDYCTMVKRLWRGERVSSNGPAGSFSNMQLHDLPEGPPPQIVFCHNGGPRASKVAADPVFDGVMPTPMLTVDAVRNSLTWTREECERIGRDPASLRVSAGVASAPEMSEALATALISVRIVFSLLLTRDFARWNGWDVQLADDVRNHPFFAAVDSNAVDQIYNTPGGRAELLEVTRQLIPESCLRSAAAVGSLGECMKFLEEIKSLGVDEVVLYTTTGSQNATLLEAWRNRDAL